LLAATVQYLVM